MPAASGGVVTAAEALSAAPRMFGVPTGVRGLDELFFTVDLEGGEPVRRPLGGVPNRSVMNVTGVPDTGKSLLVEQFAVAQASRGGSVCFVTVESPAPFVAAGLRARAAAMGADPDGVLRRVILVDAASRGELREDLPSLLRTMERVYRSYGARFTVVDSVTGLFEAREVAARSVVREVFNFLKVRGQTALLVSQKRSSHGAETAEAAGGYAVSHILDGTIVLGKEVVSSRWQESLYGLPVGEVLRTIRIDGCRMAGHDPSTRLLRITELGLLEVGPRLAELRAGAPGRSARSPGG